MIEIGHKLLQLFNMQPQFCHSNNIFCFTFWILYPFHLVSDFGTEFILEPKMAFVNEIITIKKAIFGSKMNSVPKSLTR